MRPDLFFCTALALTACATTPPADESSGAATLGVSDTAASTDTTGDDDTATTGDDDTTTTGEPIFELAACGLTPDCPALCEHIAIGDCNEVGSDAPRCAAKLLVAGEPGVLEHHLILYGQPEVETLHVMRGDGSAVLQTRTRDNQDLPWENPGAPMLCDVVLPPELAPACEADEFACLWQRSLYEKCVETTITDCAEVEAWLAG